MLPRRLALVGLALAALAGVLVLAAGELLTNPTRARAPAVPTGLHAEAVTIAVPGGAVAGWLAPGQAGKGAVLLLHGIGASRMQMVGRARFLQAAGYTTLLIDLPAHGESTGDRITFGARESAAVRASLDFLRRAAPGERLAVVGVSLGAASLLLAGAGGALAAVVIESMYPTIGEAVANRLEMRLGPPGRLLAAPLLWQLSLRLGVSERELQPIRHLAALAVPIAVASGTHDQHTTWPETLRLYESAASPKELWAFAGAAHVDLHRYAPELYQQRLLAFLARHVREEDSQVGREGDSETAGAPLGEARGDSPRWGAAIELARSF
jgi:alpha-beta hydrolase superfamily lysophospholipase